MISILASTALYPASDMVAKTLTADLPALEIAWMRYAVLLLVLIPFGLAGRLSLATARPGQQILRGAASALSTAVAILAFSFLPVANATAISFVTPVIVTGLAFVFLKETVCWRRWLAATVGFCGILIMVQPGASTFQPATMIPLLGSLFGAVSVVATRALKFDRIGTTLAISTLVGFCLLSAALPAIWRTPTLRHLELGLLMGLLAAGASVAQVMAYRFASASILAPFSYTQLIWAGALGLAVFGTIPSAAMLVGCGVIMVSGALSAWRKRTGVHGGASQPTLLIAPPQPTIAATAFVPAR